MFIKILLIWISLFETGMLYWLLCGTVLEKKYFRRKEWGILVANVVGVGVNTGINRSLIFFSQYVFVANIIITCICVTVINRQNKLLKIIVIILYNVMVALLDFCVAFMSMTVLKHQFMVLVFLRANSITKCVLFICSRIIIAGCIYLIVKRKPEESYICEFQNALLLIVIAMCLILRRYHIAIVRMICESKEQEAGATGLSLMGIVLVIFFIGVLYLKNKTIEKEKELLSMRDTMVTQKIMELERVMEKNRQLSHDLKHHMFVLNNYAEERNYEGIHRYIEEIEHEFFEIKTRVWTGNSVADMLLEQKRTLAEQEEITFTIQAVPISKWPFNDSETCSLLGNLLDNAIEACNCVDCNMDKWISIKIESQKELLFIKIENAVKEAPAMKNEKPISVKRDKVKHGYGLKSVERIVNKYEGTIAYQSKNKAFQVKLLF